MIKAQELRINNLISNRNGFKMKVVSIHDDGTIYCDFDGNKGDVCEFDEKSPCYGIPLTEEILLKCGFVKSSNKLMFLPMPKIKAELHYEKHNYGNVITIQSDFGMLIPDDIEYVNQLQNLYFALTGEELEVKL